MRPIRSLYAGLLIGLLSLVHLTALAGEAVLHPNDVVRVKISGVPLKDVKVVSGLYLIDGQGRRMLTVSHGRGKPADLWQGTIL